MTTEASEEFYTLLGVRPDGVASVVDLVAGAELKLLHHKAEALLEEHRSCERVEIWRDGILIDQFERAIA